MNREIKFRGIREDNREWIYGFLCAIKDDYAFIRSNHGIKSFCVILKTVGQFTGLQDMNGNEIYEGDILNVYTTDTMGSITKTLTEVMFVANTFFFRDSYFKTYNNSIIPKGYPICDIVRFFDTIDLKIEVIGNIHDNPELLTNKIE